MSDLTAEPIPVFNEILEILRRLKVLNHVLDNASEVEKYRIQETSDPSRGGEYPNFFAIAIQTQAVRLTEFVERS